MKVKLYLGEAFGLIGKTLPFVWVRLGSYLLLGLCLTLIFAVTGGVALMLGRLWAPLGFLVFLLAFSGAFGVVRWSGRYYFYLLKAAHVAVMTEFIVHGVGPQGSQIAYGKQQVLKRFKDTSVLFGVDMLVDGSVKAFTRTFTRLAGILPVPGLDGLLGILRRVATASTTYIDEAILSRAYKEREGNVWKIAQDGVLLYAQAWKPILANAAVLTLLGAVEFLALLIIFGIPAAAIGAALPGLRIALGFGVLIFAWVAKVAVADAFALAATLLAYHRSTADLQPDPEWKAKLAKLSPKFSKLGEKVSGSHAETEEAVQRHLAPTPVA